MTPFPLTSPLSDATADPDDGFMRHIRACNARRPDVERHPFRLGGHVAGWVEPTVAAALRKEGLNTGDGFALPDASGLEALGRRLAALELYRPHDELFDVRATPGGPALGRIDRGALPLFGFFATGVHMNGLVQRSDGLHLWVGRRARDKRLDPAKLDHLVAGGVPAGYTPDEALLKEAEEEASLPPDVTRQARGVGVIRYAMDRPEGLRRDALHCYDLLLPETFVPRPADGEVEEFLLLPLSEVFVLVRDTDEFKFNVNLVLIDLFLRFGMIDPESTEGRVLRAGLNGPVFDDEGAAT
ncbi:NUDIX domain-containing protein [Acetobacter sacchari]|uniref:NUDIX domain-containing protein n=1 Tax=Acetobacter sacchari TaxID=2661687 RepID=A0ABS3M0B5_9PROT|nr:NUDIX domain-containing protein [Acetobacter sacchari]MBO1361635.1 NUDIX domain-containing protein [Acetobacter sacchari]